MPSLEPSDCYRMTSSLSNCPVCQLPVEGDAKDLEEHVNNHLDEHEEEQSTKLALELSEGATIQDTPEEPTTNHDDQINSVDHVNNVDGVEELTQPAERMMLEIERTDAALASALAESPHVHGTDTYISQSLRGSLSDSAERYYPNVLRLVLRHYDTIERLIRKKCHLSSKLDLFSSNIAGLGWDCGYRNIQMMFSALLYDPETAAELKAAGITEVPSIPEIAGRIESAWKQGFDPEGAKNFGGTLVDKDVWIGATEAFVLFRSINMNANLTDFETPTAMQKKDLYEWIFKYFEQRCNDRNCSMHRRSRLGSGNTCMISPLFCQWQGHSVTIIGAEKTRGGEIILVILDPSRGFYTSLMANTVSRLHLLRRDMNHPQFSHPRFQFVSVLPKQCANAPRGRQVRKSMLGRLRLGGPS